MVAGAAGSGEEAVDLKNTQEVKLGGFGNWLNAGMRNNEDHRFVQVTTLLDNWMGTGVST